MTDTSSRLQTINPELLVAFVFSIATTAVQGLVVLFWLVGGVISWITGYERAHEIDNFFGTHMASGAWSVAALVGLLLSLLLMLFWCLFPAASLLVTLRIHRMRNAVTQKDIRRLKELYSVLWVVLGFVAGIIPGVMLLVASTEINELSSTAVVARAGSSGFSPDDMDKLMRLKQLVDNGTITPQDFEAQKQRILGGTAAQPEATEPDELRKLKGLLDCGAISSEEYETHKRRFLEAL